MLVTLVPITSRSLRQVRTKTKGRIPDAGHTVGNGDARQAGAVLKHKIADARHAVGDDHGLQGGVAEKRIIRNAGDRITVGAGRNHSRHHWNPYNQ